MRLPPVIQLRQDDTHRLVPSKYALDEQAPLSRLADDDAELAALAELERSTDNRILGESGLLPGIGIHELMFGVSYAHIVNAAFTYAHPTGSRFNGPERGAWYAAFRLETSQAEVAFHRGRELQEHPGVVGPDAPHAADDASDQTVVRCARQVVEEPVERRVAVRVDPRLDRFVECVDAREDVVG